VRKSVKAIGQTAIKIEPAAERCVNVLLDLIATRVSYVVQEAVVVMKVMSIMYDPVQVVDHFWLCRTYSANIHRRMKGSFPLYARTSTS